MDGHHVDLVSHQAAPVDVGHLGAEDREGDHDHGPGDESNAKTEGHYKYFSKTSLTVSYILSTIIRRVLVLPNQMAAEAEIHNVDEDGENLKNSAKNRLSGN